ncbi:hypothetical protein [Crateriforma spongiae]|uniref:hypothetical protein n=1 Tax=Crateriforma spongiae TaxID=2724528 RepID=UPI0039B0A777
MTTIKMKVDVKLAAKKRRTIRPASEREPAEPAKRRGKVPRVSRLMALAIQFEEMLRNGEAKDATELAIAYSITQPRMSQIRSLTLLAPDIQEAILNLPLEFDGRSPIHEKLLRPIRSEINFDQQRQMWRSLQSSDNAT